MHIRSIQFAALSIVLFGYVLGVSASAHERTWTDSTGKHTIVAEFVSLEDGEVTLRKADGKLIKMPLSRLSKPDQAHIAKLESSAEPTGGAATEPTDESTVVEDRKKVRSVSKDFFRALVQEDDEAIKATISRAAGAAYESGNSPIKQLPTPDKGVTFRVGKIEIDQDAGTCDVSVRLHGKYQRTTLSVRRESGEWRVFAISADGPDGETVAVDFEGKEDSPPSADGEDADPSDEPTEVPDGDASQLLEFIKARLEEASQDGDKKVSAPEREKRARRILEAAEKLLDADGTREQYESAASYKFTALRELSYLGADEIADKLAKLPKELRDLGLKGLADSATSVLLQSQLTKLQRGSESDARELLSTIEKHLESVAVSADEIQLANAAGIVAERLLGDETASAFYDRVAAAFKKSDDEAIAAAGTRMEAVARRLGLVGNEMRVAGVDLDGADLDWSNYEGKVVLVDFWATWCGPCIQEMANIRVNYDAYHEKGFEVIGISVDRDFDRLSKWVEEESPPWAILAEHHPDFKSGDKLSEYYGVSGIPTTILIGPDGKVVSLNCRGARLGKLLEELLGSAE